MDIKLDINQLLKESKFINECDILLADGVRSLRHATPTAIKFIGDYVRKKVPEQNRVAPDPRILKEVLENIAFITDEELREMYLNLLASSCDSTKNNLAHPAYALILTQLNRDEAILVNKIFIEDSFKIYYFCEYGNLQVRDNTVKYLFYDKNNHVISENMLGIYINHLILLSILTMKLTSTPAKTIYNDDYNVKDVKTLKWSKTEYYLVFTDFGKLFVQASIPSISSNSSSLA